MQARTALAAAIVCGGLAVALVAADTVWGLEVEIQSQTETGWETVGRSPGGERHLSFEPSGCAGPQMRLVVTNDKPWGDTFQVEITYYNHTGKHRSAILQETWSLDRFEDRTHAFTVPSGAYPTDQTDDRPSTTVGDINIRVDDQYLYVCVAQEVEA